MFTINFPYHLLFNLLQKYTWLGYICVMQKKQLFLNMQEVSNSNITGILLEDPFSSLGPKEIKENHHFRT